MFTWQYNNVQLTGTINRLPNLYGLLNALNIFPSKSISATAVEIRYEDGKISVLPAVQRGGPPTVGAAKTGKTHYIEVPHFPHLDTITPADLQNMVEVEGDQFRPRTKEDELADKLQAVRQKHDITREYVRMGALKGVVKDGAGRTLVDLYQTFGVVKKTVDFALDNADTDIIAKGEEVFDHIATNLRGETMTGVEIMVSSSFFNKFVQHPKVEKYWLQHQAALGLAQMTRDPVSAYGRTFTFQNVDYREYKGFASMRDANGQTISEPFIAAGKGHARPVGTLDTFATYDAPPHHMDTVNKPGLEIFISQEILKHGEGVELKSQSNCIAVCRRPELLVEVDE